MEFELNTDFDKEAKTIESGNSEKKYVYQNEFKKIDFPQYLCRTCGRCCKVITTDNNVDQLAQMTKKGNEEARVFVDIFKKYENIEDAKKVVPEQVEQLLEVLTEKENYNLADLVFYYCPHITDKSLCSNYEARPTCCRRAPSHGWLVMPPGCGFEGWQFEQREYHKKIIRSLKECLYIAESISFDGKVPGKEMTIEELRKLIDEKTAPWKKYGAEFW